MKDTTLQKTALTELVTDAQSRFGALLTPRCPLAIARLALDQVAFYENMAVQAEEQLRANGIAPRYSVHHLSPAYLNEH